MVCNVWGHLTGSEYEIFKATQCYFCKQVQGLPKQTDNPVVLDCLNLVTVGIIFISIPSSCLESYVDPAVNFILNMYVPPTLTIQIEHNTAQKMF